MYKVQVRSTRALVQLMITAGLWPMPLMLEQAVPG